MNRPHSLIPDKIVSDDGDDEIYLKYGLATGYTNLANSLFMFP
jgi:hypothetical protein